MNIKSIIDYLNKQKGYAVSPDYYTHIQHWEEWWKGYYRPFHEYTEINGTAAVKRKLYTLKMAKKVCEDWASILLNEKTEIIIDHKESREFVQGKDGFGGVLSENEFWKQGNALVEKAFYSGTGAFVLKLNGMLLQGDKVLKSADTKLRIEYLSASHIIPITVRNGNIVEVAFVSESIEKGEEYIYIETHELENSFYVIKNEYYKCKNGQIEPAELPDGIASIIYTKCTIPWFAFIYPNTVNTFDNNNGLGMSVYAHAIDNLSGVDLAYNNFNRDFKLGGKKVFYNDALLQQDEQGRTVAPDDVMQQLFVQVGDGLLNQNGNILIQEFNPALRVQENKDGIQAQLDYLSFKCGLGTKHYQFNAGSVVTATQYMGDKQELVQNASKHYIIIEKALQNMIRAMLWIGREVMGLPVKEDAKITINFDDSYVIDKESERLRDLQEIRDGIMQKWEYRMKWYGEDETTAKKMTNADFSDDELMGFAGDA